MLCARPDLSALDCGAAALATQGLSGDVQKQDVEAATKSNIKPRELGTGR
jgi:hypothetical protein